MHRIGRHVAGTAGLIVLALFATLAFASGLEGAQKIAEIKPGAGAETLLAFLKRLPTSFEAQVFYGLFLSGAVGMIGSWLWKWSKGKADGFAHFTLKYIVSQVLWLTGSSIGVIAATGFQTDSGEFFGWIMVLITGGSLGYNGEVKEKKEPAA